MYCRNCGHEVQSINSPCNFCSSLPLNGKNYCQECGFPTGNEQTKCSSCLEPLKYAEISKKPQINNQYYYENINKPQNYYRSNNEDVPNTLANIVSCCSLAFTGLPIVGFILYLVWKDEKPNAARSVCYWSLFPFIALVIIYLILFMVGFFGRFLRYI